MILAAEVRIAEEVWQEHAIRMQREGYIAATTPSTPTRMVSPMQGWRSLLGYQDALRPCKCRRM